VLGNIDGVMQVIYAAVKEKAPTPDPSPQREDALGEGNGEA
jgi:hypothetical protein